MSIQEKAQDTEIEFSKKKERICFYTEIDTKEKWQMFTKIHKFKTLSNLIRQAVEFFIEYRSKVVIKDKKINLDLLESLSHELKEPLTSLKGYLQLLEEINNERGNREDLKMINNSLNQCEILETRIISHLDKYGAQNNSAIDSKTGKYDILIIEDDFETVSILIHFFTRKKCTCKGVFTGLSGLNELKYFKPKIILLDIILPDLSGYEIIKHIKANDKLKDIPVYFLTAVSESEVKEKAKEFEVTGFILKPFDLKDFKVILDYVS
ncbi:MAG: response regulator [Promethearchaeota archaeon]